MIITVYLSLFVFVSSVFVAVMRFLTSSTANFLDYLFFREVRIRPVGGRRAGSLGFAWMWLSESDRPPSVFS